MKSTCSWVKKSGIGKQGVRRKVAKLWDTKRGADIPTVESNFHHSTRDIRVACKAVKSHPIDGCKNDQESTGRCTASMAPGGQDESSQHLRLPRPVLQRHLTVLPPIAARVVPDVTHCRGRRAEPDDDERTYHAEEPTMVTPHGSETSGPEPCSDGDRVFQLQMERIESESRSYGATQTPLKGQSQTI